MSDLAGAAASAAAPRLVPLSRERHAAWRLRMAQRFAATRALSAVPVMLTEVAEASAHYPIVFVGDPVPQLAAIVGIAAGRNLFVEADGSWAEGAYVPAAVRRRPLALARTDSASNFTVLIDEADEALSQSEGVPLFDGEQPSQPMQQLLQLARELQPAIEATVAFVKALQEADLLQARVASLSNGGGGTPALVQGLSVVVRDRLQQLPDATVLDWNRRGYLAAIYFHLASEGRWPALLRRANPTTTTGRPTNGG